MRARQLNSVRDSRGWPRRGSALILTVVLTSLLAIVGVLFVMAARIDRMDTSAVSENEQLQLAVDTVVSQIEEVLVDDVPGSSGNPEYYDYPDANDPWLADLEPYTSGGNCYWRQVTDLLAKTSHGDYNNVRIKVIGERDPIQDVNAAGVTADADGDGVGDARWYRLAGVMSGKGQPIYAAVRIIDNSAMLNLNTAWAAPPNMRIDGCSQLQINAAAIAARNGGTEAEAARSLQLLRTNNADDGTPSGLTDYEYGVIWQYPPLHGDSPFTPFDISDELELRYRFVLNQSQISSRAETWGHLKAGTISTPVDSNGAELDRWVRRAMATGSPLDPNYAYRHAVTTYNMDRLLTPKPVEVTSTRTLNKRINVNTAGDVDVHEAIVAALMERRPSGSDVQFAAAQIAANLRDYIDDDNEVTVIPGAGTSGAMFYGFERPCVYLSELAYRFVRDLNTGALYRSYAIELYKPYFEDGVLPAEQWQVEIRAGASHTEQIIAWSGTRRFHVLYLKDPSAPLQIHFEDPEESAASRRIGFIPIQDPNTQTLDAGFQEGAVVSLQRKVAGNWVTVDYRTVPAGFAPADPNTSQADGTTHYLQRDVSPHKCIRRLWSAADGATACNLGNAINNYVATDDPDIIQAYPANHPLRNIGELGMVFATSAYGTSSGVKAADVLIDLRNPIYAGLFNYLTVIDPSSHRWPSDETRVMGRINVNTAPWPVIAQLPWIQYDPTGASVTTRAQAIVSYRNARGAFKSIGDLMQVDALLDLGKDGSDNLETDSPKGPDLTADDARDDYEERDLLFTRLSDLVTVRSDVFTAYILVRIGPKGSQKRMVALLDRSTTSPSNPHVRLIALYPVADPR
jgi:hypothetical protein